MTRLTLKRRSLKLKLNQIIIKFAFEQKLLYLLKKSLKLLTVLGIFKLKKYFFKKPKQLLPFAASRLFGTFQLRYLSRQ